MQDQLQLPDNLSKKDVFEKVKDYITHCGLETTNMDDNRPWGGFYYISEAQTGRFIDLFFPDVDIAQIQISEKLSPKILIVEPHKRLSWQYHLRRAEIWKVIAGSVNVVVSDDDEQREMIEKQTNDVIILRKEQRHRLIGSDGWGIIAEIWQHTHPHHPSDEDDIIRVQDDFGR
ncbi:MAG: phosphoheptose isomerase [Chitinophagaceae bacterium]|nr:phosphoheptose isomerase [Chitinophagaceae bacterium]MCW5915107.1 hypothetical protein [Chitinophagaceae bacterium]MCZ2396554.1 hypothetical protein [Chitinophagales bacterium]